MSQPKKSSPAVEIDHDARRISPPIAKKARISASGVDLEQKCTSRPLRKALSSHHRQGVEGHDRDMLDA